MLNHAKKVAALADRKCVSVVEQRLSHARTHQTIHLYCCNTPRCLLIGVAAGERVRSRSLAPSLIKWKTPSPNSHRRWHRGSSHTLFSPTVSTSQWRARDLRWHGDILTCFVVFGGTVISGGMEGSVHLWLYNHEEAVFTYRKVCHQKPLGHQASVTDMHMCTLLMHRMAHESPRSTSTPAAPSLAIAIMQEY
jgi:hypothetical protein